MKTVLVMVLTLSLGLSAWSQTMQEKVSQAGNGLFPVNHRVLIANEEQWKQLSIRFRLDTDNAFTNMETHLTIVRGIFIDRATSTELRHVLAHEAGHVRCDCYDEGTAEFWARAHL